MSVDTSAVAQRLLSVLADIFKDNPQVMSVLSSVMPSLVNVAVNGGMDVAINTFTSLTTEHSYAAWEVLMANANVEDRQALMQEGYKETVQETVKKINTLKTEWELLITAFKTACSLLTLLL